MLSALAPAALELSVTAAGQAGARRAEVDRIWRQRVERADFACDRARRQYQLADVAAPRHPGAGPCQCRGQPGGLRIVQQDQIPRPYLVEQLGSVRGEHPRVMAGLGLVERAAGFLAVDLVVQAFRDHKELGITGDHAPADPDIKILDVPDEHVEHLCHPTANQPRSS